MSGPTSASGTPALSWTPATTLGAYDYRDLNAAETASQVFALTYSGSSPAGSALALKITLTGSAAFTKTHDTSTAADLTSGKPGSVTVIYAPAATGQSDSTTLTATLIQPGGHPGPTTVATASLTLQGGSLTPDGASVMSTPVLTVGGSTGNITGTAGAVASFSGWNAAGAPSAPVIEFTLYGPTVTADCSGPPVYSGTGDPPPPGTPGGTQSFNGSWTAQSPPLSQPGTYWWTASYSGNTGNRPASSACGDPSSSVVIPAATPGKLYYTDGPIPNVFKANLDGSNPQAIVTGQVPANQPAGIAVTSSHLYWADQATGTIMQANLDGSNPQAIVTGQNKPAGLAVNGSNLYWATQGTGSPPTAGTGTIMQADLDGGNPQTIVTGQIGGLALNGSNLYWIQGGSTIMQANLDGSDPQTIPGSAAAVAVDSSRMYYATPRVFEIWAANLDGSGPKTIASLPADSGLACDMAIYDGSVYCTSIGGSSATAIYQAFIPDPAAPPLLTSPQVLQVRAAYLAVAPQ
jgi:hypothetical protein